MKRVVIKVAMKGQKSRSKALKIVGGVPGVGSVAFAGLYDNHIVVTGDGIDAVQLTKLLRKKVGPSELVSVGSVEYGSDGYGNVQNPVGGYYSYQHQYGYGPSYGYEHPYPYGPGRNGYEHPYAYGPGHGYENTNQNLYADGSGYGYKTRNLNPDSCCSMM